jgi:hypothetical protein
MSLVSGEMPEWTPERPAALSHAKYCQAAMTTLKLIGTYRVSVPEEELRFITVEVTDSAERTQEEIGSVVLLEIEVRGARDDFDVGLLQQAGSDQVPYDERFFSVDGSQLFGSDRPEAPDFRVCFFLHYFDAATPVASPYGDLVASGVVETPERLTKVCVYEHPG